LHGEYKFSKSHSKAKLLDKELEAMIAALLKEKKLKVEPTADQK
jgi:hypothetical protein